jgi:hypothetical protein
MAGQPAGDFDYDAKGQAYAARRRTDPRIAAQVHAALGAARTILNVGAGAGSYEPEGRHVIPIEPSAAMRAQRPAHLAPAIRGVAEALPLDDASVDAAMAIYTVHQWPDLAGGLAELKRVTRGPIVIMTSDGPALDRFWLRAYAPELIAAEQGRYPPIEALSAALGPDARVETVAIPNDCADGFTEAFYARPERLLDPAVRQAQSAWGFVSPDVERRFETALAADLASGAWDEAYGALRTQSFYQGSLRLVVRP